MALGVPDPSKNPKNKAPLGVPTKPNTPPANLMGKPPSTGANSPEYAGPPIPGAPAAPPGVGPTLPPSTAPVFPQDPAQPIAFNGGYINPTTAPFGFDQSQPGQVEQLWDNNQAKWFESPQLDWIDSQIPKFEDPWAGEQHVAGMMDTIGNPGAGQQFWNGVQGSFNSMGAGLGQGYTGPNNAQAAFDMTKGMLPGSLQPKFDAYYDRMKQKVMGDVDAQSAARGAYGSNAALNGSIGAGLDVEAQRAKAETDFMLADSANQMGWQGLLGNQGRNADLSGLGIFGSKLQGANYDLNKLGTFGDLAFRSEGMDLDKKRTEADLAFGVDDQALERMGAGISTAFNSQQAHRGQLNDAFDAANIVDNERDERIETQYGHVEDFSNDVMNYVTQNYDAILSGDQAAFEQQIEAMIGQAADQRGWNQQQIERVRRDMKDFADIMFKAKAAGMTGG